MADARDIQVESYLTDGRRLVQVLEKVAEGFMVEDCKNVEREFLLPKALVCEWEVVRSADAA